MITDPTAVVPPILKMAVSEIWTPTFDASPYLAAGQSISGLTAAMTKVSDGSTVALADSPTVAGNVISQKLNGPSELAGGNNFRLRFTFTLSPTTDVRVMTVYVEVSS